MSKLLLSVLLATMLIDNFAYAETIKSTKKIKSADTNQTMSDDEFMKEFMKLDQELEAAKKTGKTLDEINKLLGVDSKKK